MLTFRGFFFTLYILKVIPIFLTCLAFDYLLKSNFLSLYVPLETYIVRAVIDNVGHATIAMVTWVVFKEYSITYSSVLAIALCGAVASLIDVDHFVHARSLNLKDAVSLPSRPPLHNSSILLLLLPVYGLSTMVKETTSVIIQRILLIIFIAVLSHHLRDANRRGVWFWPVGSTPPLPGVVYMSLVALLPALSWYLQKLMTFYSKGERSPEVLHV